MKNEIETTQTAKHTPLPWKISIADRETVTAESGSDATSGRGTVCTSPTCRIKPYYDSETRRANAEFIIRACNSHYELVKACEAAKHAMNAMPREYRHFIHHAIEQVGKALAKAEGKC